jgi:sulfite oxidase
LAVFTGIWVTYKDGVYDVTKFVEQHPGGAARLMLAAGGSIDPFWAMYQQHNNDQVDAEPLAESAVGRWAL